jgi:preprotein translocase subunit SecD
MMRTLTIVPFLFCLGTASAQVTFAVRMVVPCGGKDASAPITVEGTQLTFCLKEEPIVDQDDVESAEATMGAQDNPEVRLTLAAPGSQKLLAATRENIGARLGVVLNGRLINTPVIKAAISNDILITGKFTREEANQIASAFNHRTKDR